MRGAFAVALIWAQCVLLGTVSAQSLSGDVEKGRSPATGRVHHITGPEGTALLLPQGVKPDLSDAYQALNIYGEHLGIKFPEQELEMVRTERCSLGQIHHTFQQVYLGVDVFSGVIKVHLNPDGSPLTINGDFYPMPKKFGITPAITEEEALIFAEAALEQSVLVQTADSELVIANPGWWGDAPLAQPVLAHHLVLESPEMLAEHVLIDAMTGALVDHWPAVHSALFREVYDGIAGGLPGNLARTEGEAATGDVDIDNAYDTSGDLYRLLFDGLGRDSLDDAGFTMASTVHWNDGICPNAIWNGNQSAFCDGLATDDVVAHEFAHGLTQFTADLIYQNQSGQLNEAFSDIFGETIDLWNGDVSSPGAPGGTPWPVGSTGGGLDTPNTARTACNDGSARWRMGEETSLDAIRDMWFPECFNDPPSTTDPLYNQNACGPFDNGGVHIGSGVLNHSFAMLVDGKDFNGQTVGSIGLTKTAAVYFRALTVYMTAGTDFPEAETLINQAAADLINSAPNDPRTGNPGDLFTQGDADQVATAMIAVGMSEAVCGQVPPGPPPANDACAGSVPVFVGLNDIDSNNATSGGPPGDSTQCDGTFLGDVGNDIWYSYVAPEDGLLTVSTCNIANWDTDLLVYSGTCGGGLTQLACNGDFGGCSTFTSTVENVPVTGGETYRIRVASWSDGTTGTGQLDVAFVGGGGGPVENCTNGTDDDGDGQIDCDDTDCATNPACVPVAPGDECLTATVAIVGVNPLDTTTATQSADPYDDALCTGTALGQMVNDVWFQFTAPITGDYTISTCDTIDFDSDLFVYTGACGALTPVACNGDGAGCGGFTSLIETSLNGGDVYYIRVGGWNAAAVGSGNLEIESAAPPPPPEQCNNGTDDDGDGLADCEDTDCIGDPDCVCEGTTALTCSQNSGNNVLLSWANGEVYDQIEIRRDGVLVASISGTATSHIDNAVSIGDHVYSVAGSCGGNQQAPASTCNVEVQQTAGFTMTVLDVNSGYSPAGAAFSAEVVCQELASNPGFPTNTAGFSLGLGHDSTLLEAISAAASGPVADLDGGSGPSFFDSASYPDGLTVGCVYSFTFAETIPMVTETALVSINYETVPGALASTTGTVTSTLQFVDNLGVPPVQNVMATDAGVAVGVIGQSGTVTLEPSGFILTAADQTVPFPESTGIASFEASFSMAEDATNVGYPNETQGFSFGVTHDPSILTPISGAGALVLENLNGGTGADFIDVNLFTDGFTVGCVYSFQGTATIQFASDTELVTATYDTVAGRLAGSTADVTTVLSVSDSLGNPPVQVIVVVDSQSAGVTGIDGAIVLTPVVGGFVRGDVNDDSTINLADAISLLEILFLGGVINCQDATDTNDDEQANIADAIYLLGYLFTGGDAPPPPTDGVCGADPAGTALDCQEYNSCD